MTNEPLWGQVEPDKAVHPKVRPDKMKLTDEERDALHKAIAFGPANSAVLAVVSEIINKRETASYLRGYVEGWNGCEEASGAWDRIDNDY